MNEKNWNEQISRLQETKLKEHCERIQKNLEHQNRTVGNLMRNQAEQSERLALFKRHWRERDQKHEKNLKQIATARIEQKENEILESWHAKIDAMTKKMESDMISKLIWFEMKNQNEDIRKARAEKVKQGQMVLIEKLRNKEAKIKSEMDREKAERYLRKSIIQSWMKHVDQPENEDKEYYRIVKSVNIVMAAGEGRDPNARRDRYMSMILSRERAEKERKYPVEVSYALDYLLEKVIERWASKLLRAVVDGALEQVIEHGLNELGEQRKKTRGVTFSTPPKTYDTLNQLSSGVSTLQKDSPMYHSTWELHTKESPTAESPRSRGSDHVWKSKHRGVRLLDKNDELMSGQESLEEVLPPKESSLGLEERYKYVFKPKKLARDQNSSAQESESSIDSQKWIKDFDQWEEIRLQRARKLSETTKESSIDTKKWEETYDGCNDYPSTKSDEPKEAEHRKSVLRSTVSTRKSYRSSRKTSAGVQFGEVDVIVPPFEISDDKLKPIKGRRLTPVPSNEELAGLAHSELFLPDLVSHVAEDIQGFPHKEAFEILCESVAKKLSEQSKSLLDVCIEPRTRYRAIASLARVHDSERTDMADALSLELLTLKPKEVFEGELFAWVVRGITRDACQCLFNIGVRQPDVDAMNRTRIMCMRNGPKYYIKN